MLIFKNFYLSTYLHICEHKKKRLVLEKHEVDACGMQWYYIKDGVKDPMYIIIMPCQEW